MNVISLLCGRLNTFSNILSGGKEEHFDPEGSIEEVIELCDVAMVDLKSPTRLRQLLEEEGRRKKVGRAG